MAIGSVPVNNSSDILVNSFNKQESINTRVIQLNKNLQTKIGTYLETHKEMGSLASTFKNFNKKAQAIQTKKATIKALEHALKKADSNISNKADIKTAKKMLRQAKWELFKSKFSHDDLSAVDKINKAYTAVDEATVASRKEKFDTKISIAKALKTNLESIQKTQSENTAIDEIDLYSKIDIEGLPKGLQTLVDNYNKELETLKQDYQKAVTDIANQVEKASSDNKNILGEGSFGIVYKSGNYVIKLANEGVDDDDLILEIKNNKDLKSGLTTGENLEGRENLTAFVGATKINGRTAIVYERVEGKDFFDHLQSRDMGLGKTVFAMLGFIKGLQVLHDSGMVHNDIKPENVMLTKNYLAKIIDLGLAQKIGSERIYGGTPGYMAPEILSLRDPNSNQVYSREASSKSDVFSTGVLFMDALFTGTMLGDTIFKCLQTEQLIKMQGNFVPKKDREFFEEFKDTFSMSKISNALNDVNNFEDLYETAIMDSYGQAIDPAKFTKEQFKSMLQIIAPCLNTDPDQRPTAGDLKNQLEGLLTKLPDVPEQEILAPKAKHKHNIPVPPAIPPPPPKSN